MFRAGQFPVSTNDRLNLPGVDGTSFFEISQKRGIQTDGHI